MTRDEEIVFVTDLPALEGYRPALRTALEEMRAVKGGVAWRLGASVALHGTQIMGWRATGRPIAPAVATLIAAELEAAEATLGVDVTALLTLLLLQRWYRAYGCCGTCGVYGHGPIGCPVLRHRLAWTRAERN